ncbi:hypothetical protein MNBD_BACTEROID05-33, partial [hydrothermal vent metagenome]
MSSFVDVEAEQTERFNRLMAQSKQNKSNYNTPANQCDAEFFAGCSGTKNNPHNTKKINKNKGETALQKLKALSVTDRVDEMEKQLGSEEHIFDGLAVKGQLTLFFAKPNTGKTLLFFYLIVDAIEKGLIKPKDVFYINADDDFRGVVKKGAIAKQYGFELINPAEAGMSSTEVIEMLLDLANSPESKGKIIILDTVKKFVNLMSKHEQSKFYSDMRILAINEMSVIMAGHANKYLDAEGELIYEGTADTLNDIDCVFSINMMSPIESDEMVIEFRRTKSRGDVAKKMTFKYDNRLEVPWDEKLESVKPLEDKAANIARYEKIKADKIQKHESAILFVSALLKNKSLNQSEITKQHTNCL